MALYKNKYRVETIRLKNWDYSNDGYYFITVCTKNKIPIFGFIKNGEMILNKNGQIIKEIWEELPKHYNNIKLHEIVIMPDHIHGIIEIQNKNVETPLKGVSKNCIIKLLQPVSSKKKKYSLSEIIRGFKTFSARKINELEQKVGRTIWQERFYDHIIRNEKEYEYISEYIKNNPIKEHLGNEDYLMIKEMEKKSK
ncbi:MAG: transposase [Candidatus Goldbacteria bacterium]|nr:transposase [Candidatus Goldiibacteriota bacterium]